MNIDLIRNVILPWITLSATSLCVAYMLGVHGIISGEFISSLLAFGSAATYILTSDQGDSTRYIATAALKCLYRNGSMTPFEVMQKLSSDGIACSLAQVKDTLLSIAVDTGQIGVDILDDGAMLFRVIGYRSDEESQKAFKNPSSYRTEKCELCGETFVLRDRNIIDCPNNVCAKVCDACLQRTVTIDFKLSNHK